MQRLALAELMARDPRPVQEIVLDHVHTLDVIARDTRLSLVDGETVTVDQLDRIVETAKIALQAAKLGVDTGAAAQVALAYQRRNDEESEAVAGALVAMRETLLDFLVPLPEITVNPAGHHRALTLREKLRTWLLEAARAGLLGHEIPAPPSPSLAVALVEAAPATPDRVRPAAAPADDPGPGDDEPAEPAPAEPAPAPVVTIKRAHSPDPAGASPWGRGQGPMSAVVGERPRPRD